MKQLLLFLLTIAVLHTDVCAQSTTDKRKLGLLFQMSGPYKIHREAFINLVTSNGNVDKSDEYYHAIMFLKDEKVNPVVSLKKFYENELAWRNFEVVVVDDSLTTANFPNFNSKKRKYFPLDLRSAKAKYGVDQVLVVDGTYGMEFEDLGDKRTNIHVNNFIVNTADNTIEHRFFVGDIQNIKKRNLLNPPDYPNIAESMKKLLNEKIYLTLLIEFDYLKE